MFRRGYPVLLNSTASTALFGREVVHCPYIDRCTWNPGGVVPGLKSPAFIDGFEHALKLVADRQARPASRNARQAGAYAESETTLFTGNLYWQKSRSPKRKNQNSPIECQYQAAQSTIICRYSTFFNPNRPQMAAKSDANPTTRWAAWAPVMR